MRRKRIEDMDRAELIGMVAALQRHLDVMTSAEHARLYQLGRLQEISRRGETPPTSDGPVWKRLLRAVRADEALAAARRGDGLPGMR